MFWLPTLKINIEFNISCQNICGYLKMRITFSCVSSVLIDRLAGHMWLDEIQKLRLQISISFQQNSSLTDLSCWSNSFFKTRLLRFFSHFATDRFTDLVKLNLLMVVRFKQIYTTAPSTYKNNAQLKSDQNWLKNNHLASLI